MLVTGTSQRARQQGRQVHKIYDSQKKKGKRIANRRKVSSSRKKMLFSVFVYCQCTTMVAVYWTSGLVANKLMELTAIWLCLVTTSSRNFFAPKAWLKNMQCSGKKLFKYCLADLFRRRGTPQPLRNIISPKEFGETRP